MGKLKLERDFSRFFDIEEFPHEVHVCIGDKTFAKCSGMVLAQQSSIIEQIICENEGVLALSNMECCSIPKVMECLNFLYGADINLSYKNIETVLSFSSQYHIEDLFSTAFDWVLERITIKNLIFLYAIPHTLSVMHKDLLCNVLDNFLADNWSDVMMEVRSSVKGGKSVSCEFVLSILQQSFSSCGDIVLAWITENPTQVSFLLENLNRIDMKKHFPQSEDFTELVSYLSNNAESLQAMEKLILLQQDYFTKVCKLNSPLDLTSELENKAQNDAPVCESKTFEFYDFKDGQLELNIDSDYLSVVCVPNIPVYATTDVVELAFSSIGPVRNITMIDIDCFHKLGIISYEKASHAVKSLTRNISICRNNLTVNSFVKPTRLEKNEKRLFIKRISANTSKRDIERCFSRYGCIKDIEIIRHKKCAFMEVFDAKVVALLIHFAESGVKFKILGKNVSIERFKTSKIKHKLVQS